MPPMVNALMFDSVRDLRDGRGHTDHDAAGAELLWRAPGFLAGVDRDGAA